MPPWIVKNLHVAAIVAINLLSLGMIYATLRDDVRNNQIQIKELRDQKADETRWNVAQHEKRLDSHDAAFLSFGLKIEDVGTSLHKMNETLIRIDQRTSQAGKPGMN
jgi:CHASE1-domain containing sensor protein